MSRVKITEEGFTTLSYKIDSIMEALVLNNPYIPEDSKKTTFCGFEK